MKKIWFLGLGLALFAYSQKPFAASPAGADGKTKNVIMIDGKMYIMKFADANQNAQVNEYYLQNETPETWTTMASVSVYLTKATPAELAKRMEKGLLQEHPDAPHDFAFDEASGRALFMCLNWVGQDRKTTSEYTVYRFQKHPRGVLAYQLSLRPYQAKISDADYKALRERWGQTIQKENWPPDVIVKK